MKIRAVFVASVLAVSATGIAKAQAQTIWQADWLASSPPTLAWVWPDTESAKPNASTAFADDGDILLGARSGNEADYQLTRISATGDLRWAFSMYGWDRAYANLPAADGGAFLAVGVPSAEAEGRILRIAADGTLAWSREVATGWLAEVGSDRVATSSCARVTMVDAHSGDVLWQRRLKADHAPCSGGGLAVDANGAIYAAFDNPGQPSFGYRIIKFDQDGTELWNVVGGDPGITQPRLLGLAGTMLVLETSADVRGLSAGSGAQSWSVAHAGGAVVISQDVNPEPIVLDAASVRRIDAQTGAVRWEQPGRPVTRLAQTVGDLVLATDEMRVDALDVATGALQWTLPNTSIPVAVVDWLGFGRADDAHLVGVTTAHAPVAPAPYVQRIETSSGVLERAIATPDIAQGIQGSSIRDEAGGIVSVGLAAANGHSEFHMRRVDGTTGLQQWRIVEALEDFDSMRLPTQLEVASQGDAIAVTMTRASLPYSCATGGGLAHVRLHDRATGAVRWHGFVTSVPGDGCVLASAPAFTQGGDIVFATGAQVACAPGTEGHCQRESWYMLSAADGSIRWRIDRPLVPDEIPLQAFPGAFAIVGDDVLVREPIASGGASLRRLSGLDGSVVWSSNIFTPDGIGDDMLRVDANHIVVYRPSQTAPAWGKIRLDTGATVWTSPVPPLPACTVACQSGDSLVLPGGDHIAVGARDYGAVIQRWHNDGSGIVDDWPAGPASPTLKSSFSAARLDAAGDLRVYLHKRHRGDVSMVSFLATFDLETATLRDQQAVSSTRRPPTDSVFPALLDVPAADRLLVDRHVVQPPVPTTSGASLIDTSVVARGNIAIEAAIEGGVVAPGELASFHVRVTYAGDAPITNARLVARMPWRGGIRAVQCATTDAVDCVVDTRSGDLEASFGLEPGGSVELTGQLLVLAAGDTATLSAFAHGPVGLGEQDTDDNFVQATTAQALFRSGFEASP